MEDPIDSQEEKVDEIVGFLKEKNVVKVSDLLPCIVNVNQCKVIGFCPVQRF